MFFSHRQMSRLDRFEDRANAAAAGVVRATRRVNAKRRQQQRVRILAALSAAVGQRNFEEVQKLVEECAELLPERGLHLPAVASALALIPRLAEEGRVRVDLKRGMEQRDSQLLHDAITAAVAMDPPLEEDELLVAARALLLRIEREATLEVDLTAAIAASDHTELVLLLDLAADLALESDDVRRAQELRTELDKSMLDAVDAAAREMSLEKLEAAVAAATKVNLVSSPNVVAALPVLEELKLQAAALQALETACKAVNAGELQAAIEAAEKFDRPSATLAQVIATARKRQSQLIRMESIAADLTASMQTSSAGENFKDLDHLVALVAEAKDFYAEDAVVPDVVADAASMSAVLLEQRDAAKKLVAAIEADDKDQLTEHLAGARALALEHDSVHRAEKHLALLSKREDVCKQLRELSASATSRRGIASSSEMAELRGALAAAKDVGLPNCDELMTVRLLVIDADLALAIETNTEEALSAAIYEAMQLQVETPGVMSARGALSRLQRQAEVRREQQRLQVR